MGMVQTDLQRISLGRETGRPQGRVSQYRSPDR